MKSMLTRAALVVLALSLLALVGCGSDDNDTADSDKATGQYANVKNYLTGQTSQLKNSVTELASQAVEYSDLIEKAGSCEAAVKDDEAAVVDSIKEMQATWRKANPQYEKAEGVVAGVPSLAEFDVILDAGASKKDDPENAVPFDITYEDGTTLKQPGNFFFLTETSLWGTTKAYTCDDVEVEIDGVKQGIPLPQHIVAVTKEMQKYAEELDTAANAWKPSQEDVFTAVVVMTPTMAEYFEAWKNSRFVAGDDASEASFVGASRLEDIAGILSGLNLVYENIEGEIAEKNKDQAEQIGEELKSLLAYVEKIRDQEADGKKFTAEQADTYGSEAQERAERIAGQISQAASELGVTIQE